MGCEVWHTGTNLFKQISPILTLCIWLHLWCASVPYIINNNIIVIYYYISMAQNWHKTGTLAQELTLPL